MPLTKSYVNKNHKWNWNLAFMLYCGGMPLSAILANENFKGLTYNTLVCKANTDNWYGKKGELEEKAYNHGAKELADRIAEAKVQHQQFMLDQIEEEREAILQDFKFPGSKMRKERLDALRTLDDIARKNLGLDDEKLITHEEKIFGMLISLQKQPPKQIEGTLVTRPEALEVGETVHETNGNESKRTSLAILPLPDNKNATTGILSSANAIPEVDKTPEMQSDEEKEPTHGEWKPNPEYDKASHELDPNTGFIVERRSDGKVAGEDELERIANEDLENQANEDLRNLAEQILERPRGLKTLKPLVV